MSDTKQNIFGNQAVALVTLLLAIAVWRAPDIIKAIRTGPDSGPVSPVEPVTPAEFKDWVRKLKPAPAETADLIANYEAMSAVLQSKVQINSTPELWAIFKLARELAYPGQGPREGSQPLVRVIRDEAVARGLLARDEDEDRIQDEPLPVDRAGWLGLFDDVLEGLQ